MFKGPELATYADMQAGTILDGRILATTGLDPSTNPEDVLVNVTALSRTMRIMGIGELVLAGEQGEAAKAIPVGSHMNPDGSLTAVGAKVKSATLARTGVSGGDHEKHFPWLFWPQATVTINRTEATSRISDEVFPGPRQKTREQAWAGVIDEVLRRGMLDAAKQTLTVGREASGAAYGVPALLGVGVCSGDYYTTTFGGIMYVAGHAINMGAAKYFGRMQEMRWSLLPFGAQGDRHVVGWGYAHLHQYAGARKGA